MVTAANTTNSKWLTASNATTTSLSYFSSRYDGYLGELEAQAREAKENQRIRLRFDRVRQKEFRKPSSKPKKHGNRRMQGG